MEKENKTPLKQALMLKDPVGHVLFKMTVPMILGIASILLFNVVDTFYIGQLGEAELAAISFTFPVVFVVMSISMGIGIGASAVVSKAIGEGNLQKVRRLTTDSLILALVLVVAIAVIGRLTIDPIFQMLGANPEMLVLIHDYMDIWFLGIGFLVIPMVGNSAIRATGDAKTPSYIMMIAGFVNVVLDPFLIFGIGPFPRLGLAGAALATIIAYVAALVAALWILGKREKMFTLDIPKFSEVVQSWKKIAFIGVPAAATNLLAPVSIGVLTRMIAEFGEQPVAAFGVGSRLESLSTIGVMALSSVLTPFVGQNWGARQYERVQEAIRLSFKFSLLSGVVVYLVLVVTAYPISWIFTDSEAIGSLIVQFLWIVPVSYGCYGIVVLGSAVFNALQKPFHSTMLLIIRLFVLTIPLAYLGAQWGNVPGIFVGMTVANVIIGGFAYWFVGWQFKSLVKLNFAT